MATTAFLTSEGWTLTAATLALLAAPAASSFYAKDSQKGLHLAFSICAAASLMWALIGFSEVYGQPLASGVVGQDTYGPINRIVGTYSSPYFTFVVFELAFALLTLNLIQGAVGHLFKPFYFAVYAIFALTLIYCPQAMWFWNNGNQANFNAPSVTAVIAGGVPLTQGWALNYGIVDNAGGMVVHLTAGIASLVLGILAGGWEAPSHYGESLPCVAVAVVAQFAMNAGKAVGGTSAGVINAVGIAATTNNLRSGLALINTQIAASTGVLAYCFMEYFLSKEFAFGRGIATTGEFQGPSFKLMPQHFTVAGAAKGVMISLASVATGASLIAPMWTVLTTFITVVVVYLAETVLHKTHLGAGKTVFLTHGLGGAVGACLTGIFANNAYSGAINGAFFRNGALLGNQVSGVLTIVLMTSVSSAVIFFALQAAARVFFNHAITSEDAENFAPELPEKEVPGV